MNQIREKIQKWEISGSKRPDSSSLVSFRKWDKFLFIIFFLFKFFVVAYSKICLNCTQPLFTSLFVCWFVCKSYHSILILYLKLSKFLIWIKVFCLLINLFIYCKYDYMFFQNKKKLCNLMNTRTTDYWKFSVPHMINFVFIIEPMIMLIFNGVLSIRFNRNSSHKIINVFQQN